MPIKSILVQLDSSDACDLRLKISVELAQRFNARLSGSYTEPPLSYYRGSQTMLDPSVLSLPDREIIERHQQAEKKLIQNKLDRQLHETCQKMQWRSNTGHPHQVMAENGRYHDLLVVSQGINDGGALAGFSELAADISIHAGIPVLMVPQNPGKQPPPIPGRSIIVAWNGSREATRALHDALPLLQYATIVEIFHAVEKNQPYADYRQWHADIRHYLQLHGIDSSVFSPEHAESEASESLLNRTNEAGHDLIVMGAYSHSRLRDLFLGSMTRDVLKKAEVSVLLSH